MEKVEMEIIAQLLNCEIESLNGEAEIMDAVIAKFLEEEKSKPQRLSCGELFDIEEKIRKYLDENFNGDIMSHATFRYLFFDDEDENPLGDCIMRSAMNALGFPPDFDDDLDD
jgi:hypothetical protein